MSVVENIWNDLREKRLWPIALALVLAIVAIPVLLTSSAAKRSSDAPLSAPPPAVAEQGERVTVELDGGDAASTAAGSSLDRFAEGDPFTPPAAIARRGGGDAATSASAAGPSSDADADADAGGPGAGAAPAPDAAPETPDTVAPPVTRTETAEYQYVADVTFWNGDRRRSIRGLRKLDMLPNERAPVLIFMGTAGDGGNAVFLVDSTLKAAGEGRCVPGGGNCVYVHVGPGSEHTFTTETGDAYRLRVEEIRKVKLTAGASAARRPVAGPATGAAAPIRRFELPSFVDLIVETTATTTTAAPAEAAPPAQSSPAPAQPDSSPARDGR